MSLDRAMRKAGFRPSLLRDLLMHPEKDDTSSTSSSSFELPQLSISPMMPYVQIGKELQDLRKDVFKLYQNLALSEGTTNKNHDQTMVSKLKE